MTKSESTGYFIEVQMSFSSDIRYLGLKGLFRPCPHFFTDPKMVIRTLNVEIKAKRIYTLWQITVIKVEHLNLGIQKSTATRMSAGEFLGIYTDTVQAKRINDAGNAIYKLEAFVKDNGTSYLVGGGKFGKTWDKAVHLRQHLARNIRRLGGVYKDAEVLEIVMNDDKITTNRVIRVDVVDFFTRSPTYKEKYQKAFPVTSLENLSVKPERTL